MLLAADDQAIPAETVTYIDRAEQVGGHDQPLVGELVEQDMADHHAVLVGPLAAALAGYSRDFHGQAVEHGKGSTVELAATLAAEGGAGYAAGLFFYSGQEPEVIFRKAKAKVAAWAGENARLKDAKDNEQRRLNALSCCNRAKIIRRNAAKREKHANCGADSTN